MATSAKKSQRSELQYGDGGSPELFTTWAEVFNIDPAEATSAAVNVTSHDSTAAEFISASVPDYGELTGEAFFINDATDTAVRGKLGGAASNWQLCFPNWGARTKAFTANAGQDTLSVVSTHGLTTGQPFRVSTTVTLPSPLEANTTYYARVVDADSITVHTTNAGAVADTGMVDLTSTGTGTHTLQIGTRIDFAGIVTSNKNAAPLDGALTQTIKAKLSGAATYV